MIRHEPKAKSRKAVHYSLSPKGHRYLARLRRDGNYPELPPTYPQRLWMREQIKAQEDVPRLRRQLKQAMRELATVLDSDDPDDFRLPDGQPYEDRGDAFDRDVRDLRRALKALRRSRPSDQTSYYEYAQGRG